MRRPGKPPRFETADVLWDKFLEYLEEVDANPWQVKSASNSISDTGRESKNNAMRQDVRVVARPYTLQGFCSYTGIAKWADFKRYNAERSPEFRDTICAIENKVQAQQIDGAMIHQFDGSLVARLNGFADKQTSEVSYEFRFPRLTPEDIDELKRLNAE